MPRQTDDEESHLPSDSDYVTPPTDRHKCGRYPFGGVRSNSIPSPVKRIHAPQSQLISNDDEDEWEVIAEYAINHQQAMDAHDIFDDIYRHAEIFMHESGTVMQPDYVGKPEDLYL